jgi:hypothetical protein
MKVADFTAEELRALIRETVAEALAEQFADPDRGLELREDFEARLAAALDSEEPDVPAEEVARRLGFSW